MLNKTQSIGLFAICFSSLISQNLYADSSIQEVIRERSWDQLISHSNFIENQKSLDEAETLLWNKYLAQISNDSERKKELSDRKIKYGDKTMRFTLEKRGTPGPNGYPLYIALHGGGGAPPSLNDSQWRHMSVYYKESVDNGIYVATRGVTDTWNLHFVAESYPLYDHLITSLIALENVDPNRVYLMGFSAGGDGVYQITPRMPDRWSAVNMSAGHNNWIRFDNLSNVPFLMQMGSNDGAYKRNKNAVENYIQLNQLREKRGGYIHELFLHDRGSHNSWRDNDPKRQSQRIITNLIEWLNGATSVTTQKDTNAVHWMNQYSRQPYPSQIFWDYEINAPRDYVVGKKYITPSNQAKLNPPKNLFYWLNILEGDQSKANLIHASINSTKNQIQLSHLDQVSHIRVLLRTHMLDFNKSIKLNIDGQEIDHFLPMVNLQTMARTLLERGDRSYIFHNEIELKKTPSNTWQVVK